MIAPGNTGHQAGPGDATTGAARPHTGAATAPAAVATAPAAVATPRAVGATPAVAAAAPAAATSTAIEAPDAAFVIRGLDCYYGPFRAVREVTLTIQRRAVTAIIGPSGCGKSTFLRALNRMHEITPRALVSGEVLLGDVNIYDPDVDRVQLRRRVGMVFQQPFPFPTMSIYDNVVAGLTLTGRHDRRALDEIVERSLRQAALWDEVKDDLRRKSGLALSGGQQQRLCIARTLATGPEVILMDEPASALDPIATLKIEELIAELEQQYTIVIVTHNMQQAARVSDQTAFFNLEAQGRPGKLIEIDETERIFSNPTQKATEDYISGRFG